MAKDTSAGIDIGDAVMRFLGDTTDLEEKWASLEERSKQSASRAINKVIGLYHTLNIEGSLELRKFADQAETAFKKLTKSGIASWSDLVQAEMRVLETQAALKRSLGETVPTEIIDGITTLKLEYIKVTGTAEEYAAAQKKLLTVEEQMAVAAKRTAAELAKEAAAQRAATAATQAAAVAAIRKGTAAPDQWTPGSPAYKSEAGESGGLLSKVSSVATGLLAYKAISEITRGLREGFDAAMEFDKAFTELTTLIDTRTPEGVMQVQALKQQLLELPPVLGDVTHLTKATYEAISAGIPAAEAVEFVGKAAVFAKAALTDEFTSVNLITTAMKSYGLGVQDVDKVSSALFATIQNGKLRGPELAESLGRVLPIAANLGISLTQVLGAADALTMGGLSADEAMTALRQTMSTIERPTAEARKAMKDLHYSFEEMQQTIATKGLLTALTDLAAKAKDNDEAVTSFFGNVRALTGVLTLVGPQAEKYAQNVKAITDAYNDSTSAQQAMDKIVKSQSGSWEEFGNTIKRDFLVYWDRLTPITNEIGKGFGDLFLKTGVLQASLIGLGGILAFTALIINGIELGVLHFTHALGGLAIWLDEVSFKLGLYSGPAEAFKKHLEEMKQRVDDINPAIKKQEEATEGIRDALDHLADGHTKGADAARKYGETQKRLAELSDQAAAAAKQDLNTNTMNAAAAALKKKELEEAAKAAEKAAKALTAYANAHNIPWLPEMREATKQAQAFYETVKRGHAPLVTQVDALINLNIQMGKLQATMKDTRTVGQMLFDMGMDKGVKEFKTELIDMDKLLEDHTDYWTGIVSRVPLALTDPLTEAMDIVREAENRLGIQGTIILARNMADAEQAVKALLEGMKAGTVSAADMARAEQVLADVTLKYQQSISTARVAMEQAMAVEQRMGINGVQTLTARADAERKAYAELEKNQAKGLEGTHTMQRAQLQLLETEMELKRAQGIPIPKAMEDSVHRLTNSITTFDRKVEESERTSQRWFDFWESQAPTMGETLHNLSDIAKNSFLDMTQAFGGAVKAFESGQKSLGAAMEEAVAQTLESISAQSAVQAIQMTAEGLAALAFGDFAAAGEFFDAAAMYAAVAVAAGAAGMAMEGGKGGSKGGGSTSQQSMAAPAQGQINPVQTQNIQRFAAGGLVSQPTLAIIGDSKSSATTGAREGILPLDDPHAMRQIGGSVADNMPAVAGDTHYHFDIDGMISADNLDTVIDKISMRVQQGKKLVATTANRVTRKS